MLKNFKRLGCRLVSGGMIAVFLLEIIFSANAVLAERFAGRRGKGRAAQTSSAPYSSVPAAKSFVPSAVPAAQTPPALPAANAQPAAKSAASAQPAAKSAANAQPAAEPSAKTQKNAVSKAIGPDLASAATLSQEKRTDLKAAASEIQTSVSDEGAAMEVQPASRPALPAGPKCFWFTDWNAAREAAVKLQRPLLIHFSMAYCGPCKRMEETVFSQETIQMLAGSYFVMVKADGNQLPSIRDHFGVKSYPTDLIVAPDGKVLARHIGYQDRAAYSSFLTAAAAKADLPPMTAPIDSHWKDVQLASSEKVPEPAETVAVSRAPATSVPTENPENLNAILEVPALETPVKETVAASAQETAEAAQELTVADSEKETAPADSASDASLDLLELEEKAPQAVASQEPENDPEEVDLFALEAPEDVQKAADTLEKAAGELVLSERAVSPEIADAAKSAKNPSAPIRPTSYAAEEALVLLDGYCPVTMVEQNAWTRGSSEFTSKFGNGIYYFVSEAEKEKFLRNPQFYALVSDGFDIVLLTDQKQKTQGTRRFGIRYADLNFVFATEESREQFRKNPDFYARQAQEIIAARQAGTLR